MGMTLEGEVDIEYEEGTDGHRDYFLTWLVITDSKWTGPHRVSQCPGLPTPGTQWTFGPDNESEGSEGDIYAVCQRYMKIVPKVTNAPNYWWLVRQQFSTRPFERPNGSGKEYTTPITEEPRIRGAFTKKTEEAVTARSVSCVEDGVDYPMRSNLIRNTAWQRFTGKQVEFDRGVPRVIISMNVIDHGNNLVYFHSLINHVNDDALWGFVARTIKLDDVSFEKMYFGEDTPFFVANLEYEIDERYDPIEDTYYSGHDRRLVNYGDHTLITNGSPNNPLHNMATRNIADKERNRIILDNTGAAWTGNVAEANVQVPYINVEYWPETNFVGELGVPAIL
jgi:hypothetical protein